MTTFAVDSQQVAAATQSVQVAVDRIREDVASLRARLHELDGSWSGEASSAFQGLASEWHQTQLRVEEVLQRLGSALDTAGRHYAQVEQDNRRLFAH